MAKITGQHLDALRDLVAPFDTEATRDAYRRGNFPRADAVKDVDRRYRADLLAAALKSCGWVYLDTLRDAGIDANDAHLDTAMRTIVRPLEPVYAGRTLTDDETEAMVEGYVTAMAWANAYVVGDDEMTTADDLTADDLPDDVRAKLAEHVRDFLALDTNGDGETVAQIVARLIDRDDVVYDAGQAGHDHALTRAHHGAGFWDRGLGADGDTLTTWSQTFGDATITVNPDGSIYLDY